MSVRVQFGLLVILTCDSCTASGGSTAAAAGLPNLVIGG